MSAETNKYGKSILDEIFKIMAYERMLLKALDIYWSKRIKG